MKKVPTDRIEFLMRTYHNQIDENFSLMTRIEKLNTDKARFINAGHNFSISEANGLIYSASLKLESGKLNATEIDKELNRLIHDLTISNFNKLQA